MTDPARQLARALSRALEGWGDFRPALLSVVADGTAGEQPDENDRLDAEALAVALGRVALWRSCSEIELDLQDEVRHLRAEILRLQSRPVGEQLRDLAAMLYASGMPADAVALIGVALRVEHGIGARRVG
jgi:hypothetical protein